MLGMMRRRGGRGGEFWYNNKLISRLHITPRRIRFTASPHFTPSLFYALSHRDWKWAVTVVVVSVVGRHVCGTRLWLYTAKLFKFHEKPFRAHDGYHPNITRFRAMTHRGKVRLGAENLPPVRPRRKSLSIHTTNHASKVHAHVV